VALVQNPAASMGTKRASIKSADKIEIEYEGASLEFIFGPCNLPLSFLAIFRRR